MTDPIDDLESRLVQAALGAKAQRELNRRECANSRHRSRKSAKDAGAKFESAIAAYLREHVDDRIERRARNGAKDRGDISGLRLSPALRSQRVVAELKDVARTDLPGWTREADTERLNDDAAVGVVIFKRRGVSHPGKQWIGGTVDDLIALITGSRPEEDE